MNFEGTFEVGAPRENVWKFLVDPNSIAKCMPDLQSLDVEGEDRFTAIVKVGLGFVKGDFKFKVALVEKQPPSHARLKASGSGAGGNVDLDTVMDLVEENGKTRMQWKAEAKVGGILAGLGQRMIGSAAERMINDFFECIRNQLLK